MPTTNDLLHAADCLLTTSWEMTEDEFTARLAAFVEESSDKIAALRYVCRLAESRRDGCKAEAATWSTAAKAADNRAGKVKERARELYCAAREVGELLPGARMQANGLAPLVYSPGFDVRSLPTSMQRVSVEPDAEAIRGALAAGVAVPGVQLGDRGEHLRWTEEPRRGGK